MSFDVVAIRNNRQYNLQRGMLVRQQAERLARNAVLSYGNKEARVYDNSTGECIYQIGD